MWINSYLRLRIIKNIKRYRVKLFTFRNVEIYVKFALEITSTLLTFVPIFMIQNTFWIITTWISLSRRKRIKNLVYSPKYFSKTQWKPWFQRETSFDMIETHTGSHHKFNWAFQTVNKHKSTCLWSITLQCEYFEQH